MTSTKSKNRRSPANKLLLLFYKGERKKERKKEEEEEEERKDGLDCEALSLPAPIQVVLYFLSFFFEKVTARGGAGPLAAALVPRYSRPYCFVPFRFVSFFFNLCVCV